MKWCQKKSASIHHMEFSRGRVLGVVYNRVETALSTLYKRSLVSWIRNVKVCTGDTVIKIFLRKFQDKFGRLCRSLQWQTINSTRVIRLMFHIAVLSPFCCLSRQHGSNGASTDPLSWLCQVVLIKHVMFVNRVTDRAVRVVHAATERVNADKVTFARTVCHTVDSGPHGPFVATCTSSYPQSQH